MQIAKRINLTIVLAILTMIVAAFSLCGCSGGSSPLNKDASLKTEWGTVLQYKISSNWEETAPSSSDSFAMIYYSSNDPQESLLISVRPYSSESTYSDWIKQSEETHTRSVQDFVDAYNDYSLDEIGEKDISGSTFRIYKQTYTVTFADAYVEKSKEKDPNFLKTQDVTQYCAVLKDDTHDMEIQASSEALLNNFVSTLTIKW